MYEPRFLDQFTKLHLWNMTMYDTLLYLDSDTLTLRSISHLLHRNLGNKCIAAAAQTWHGMFQGFNMGVFVKHPATQEYERLLAIQQLLYHHKSDTGVSAIKKAEILGEALVSYRKQRF